MKNSFKISFLFIIVFFCLKFCGCSAMTCAQNKNIDSILTLLKTDNADTNKVINFNKLSKEYLNLGLYNTARHYGYNGLKLARQLIFNKGIIDSYNNIGIVYWRQGDYPKALDYYFKALKIAEELGIKNEIETTFGNIGLVYWSQGNFTKAFDYFLKALEIAKELRDKNGIAKHLGSIGNIYFSKDSSQKALAYYLESLKIFEETANKSETGRMLGNIGAIYGKQKDWPQALDYYFKAVQIQEESGNKFGIAVNLVNIGTSYFAKKKYAEAEKYMLKALDIDTTIGSLAYTAYTYEQLTELYTQTGNYKKALEHYKKAMIAKDTLFNQDKNKEITRKEMNFEFDKKEAITKAGHNKEMAIAEAEKKKQQILIWSVTSGLFLVIMFAGFVFSSLRITRRQKNIIELQRNKVSQQNEIVEKQNEKIIDSITYAQRIQQSILMEESEIQNYLPYSFIYYQPKDIVSGDFYWCSEIDGKIILAAVDCTGHGVPGAFMSMIGNILLNQIINEKHIILPSEILRLLNIGVYEALHQKKNGALSDDGMDIALVSIDYKNNEIQYAGARNSLYVISNCQIEVIKADITEIGGGGKFTKILDPIKKVFTNHVIPIKKDMSIYLFSDGYRDQFGGNNREKFGTQKFKELLVSNQHLSMQKQKELIVSTHSQWKGNIPQIDDILVMGVKF